VFAFGCCVGGSAKFETGLLPSIRTFWADVPVLTLRGQRSIFEAYNALFDEAALLPDLEGLVLVHDDVIFRDGVLLDRLHDAFADGTVGLAGIVGGVGVREMSWWKSERSVGHVEQARLPPERYSTGCMDADLLDGMLLALSAETVRTVRLRQGAYPPFHAYDSELCSLIKATGRRVVVVDADVFHDCKPGPWGSPEYGQAILEWERRWMGRSAPRRAVLAVKRNALRTAVRLKR
jgi:hypothetical protein